jgi:multicomponent Na+:H+ antiporter subunit F
MIYSVAILALLFALALTLYRAFVGPTIFDRTLAANSVGTLAILLLVLLEFFTGRPEFSDLAMVYGILNVVGTIAVLKFFRVGDLGEPGEPKTPPPVDAATRSQEPI